MTTRCHDCRVETLPVDPGHYAEYYMVRDDVWQDAIMAGLLPGLAELGPPPIRMLCVGCLEARIGRRLTADDFIDAPIHSTDEQFAHFAWWWRSPRLQSRLGGAS